MTQSLINAQSAIKAQLRRQRAPMKPRELRQAITDENSLRDIDVREAIWILVGRGQIELTPQRTLTLTPKHLTPNT